ncbi:hypothetical protein AAF712_001568 [Marasmius tenuissimus]|uniref:Endopeptidase S2P n=1 Tax=Marasmius tenuissimus TaxID=585030 RepID=A0ABR3AAL1_9AGAR
MTDTRPRLRCIRDHECSGLSRDQDHDTGLDAFCVWPDATTSFTRIGLRHPGDEVDETLLWNGPKQEIWDQVTVSRWKPRIRFIPANAIFVVKSFLDYLVSASLSLFFFNLLPVSFLDGGHLLKAILNDLPDVRADDFDIESIDVRRFPGRWKARFESLVMYGTIGLLVVCMAMAVVRMITT